MIGFLKTILKMPKAPSYIMIEWIVGDGNKRVLTGLGVKRIIGKNNDEDDDSLRIITFVSEYEKACSFDINNIELIEESGGTIKSIDFERIAKNMLSWEREYDNFYFYRWELMEDKRKYSTKLIEHKIFPVEWKNLIVKINESEAGLNSFFNDCKSNKGLIIKMVYSNDRRAVKQKWKYY